MKNWNTLLLVAVFVLSGGSGAQAAEVSRTKLAQWGDPLTPPQSKTDCVDWASGDWPWGGGWKTCKGWRTQWRHIEVEAFLVANGPDNVGDDAKNAVVACTVVAGVAAAAAGVATNGAGALAAAKVAFASCLTAKGEDIADKYSLSLDQRSHWTDWG